MNRLQNIFNRAISAVLVLLIVGGLGFGSWALADYVVSRNSTPELSSRADALLEANAKKLEQIKKASEKRIGPEIVLTDGPDIKGSTFKFSYLGVDYTVKPTIDKRVYYGAVNADRTLLSSPGKSDRELTESYYRAYVEAPLQASIIEELCAEFAFIAQERSLSSDEYAELLVKFVQSIPYDESRAALAHADTIGEGDPRFPVQVLADGTGDCDEKVFLLAAMLNHEGYGTAALLFEEELHMSLGIAAEGEDGYKGTKYTYVETTSPAYVSDAPVKLESGQELLSDPEVLVLGEGKKTYSHASVEEVELIIMARDTALDAAKMKEKEIKNFKGSDKARNKLISQYDACYEAYNTFQETVNEKGATEDAFKDRAEAFEWLSKNGWWVWFS